MEAGLVVPEHFLRRQDATAEALKRLRATFGVYGLDEERAPHVALYTTGSLGRSEVGTKSDLDVFLVDTANVAEGELKNLHQIELLADLIRAARDAGFGEFSRDGEYLTVHRLPQLVSFLGTRQDDSTNVFTARMLLLLESENLLGDASYSRCIDAVLEVYARDAGGKDSFRPTFLTNDIVRYWKTLCLNYEAKRHEYHAERSRQLSPDEDADAHEARIEALRLSLRVDLLKLRFNRLWTCFNGLAYLLAGVHEREVTKAHVHDLVWLKPIERAEKLAEIVPEARAETQTALNEYAAFLSSSDADKSEVESLFSDDEIYRAMRDRAETFAGAIDAIVRVVAGRSGIERFLLL